LHQKARTASAASGIGGKSWRALPGAASIKNWRMAYVDGSDLILHCRTVFRNRSDQTVVSESCLRGMTGIQAEQAIGSHAATCSGPRSHGQAFLPIRLSPGSGQRRAGAVTVALRITHADGKTVQINVGTMLMPSSSHRTDGTWCVVPRAQTGRKLLDCGRRPANLPSSIGKHPARSPHLLTAAANPAPPGSREGVDPCRAGCTSASPPCAIAISA
jgi:hypothetical protein